MGSKQEVSLYQGEDTPLLAVQGLLVIASCIEGYGHFLGLGQAQQILDLSSVETFQDIVSLVAAAVGGTRQGACVFRSMNCNIHKSTSPSLVGRSFMQEKFRQDPQS